ncbi:uncharacterized protein Dmul_26510 [Desulfococcus multivorans]|nr:uncharacterized protein Dmul_26510 [Desulfococcus multivorans]
MGMVIAVFVIVVAIVGGLVFAVIGCVVGWIAVGLFVGLLLFGHGFSLLSNFEVSLEPLYGIEKSHAFPICASCTHRQRMDENFMRERID